MPETFEVISGRLTITNAARKTEIREKMVAPIKNAATAVPIKNAATVAPVTNAVGLENPAEIRQAEGPAQDKAELAAAGVSSSSNMTDSACPTSNTLVNFKGPRIAPAPFKMSRKSTARKLDSLDGDIADF